MYTAKIQIGIEGQGLEAAADFGHDLLSCLYKNGQILGKGWAFVDSGATVDAYVTIPDLKALHDASNNEYVTGVLEDGRHKGLVSPKTEILGVDPLLPTTCSCANSSALVLYTHYLTDVPPVRCLDCFQPVPLYGLPHVHDKEHLVILQWAADYVACDTLQMHCTTDERFGEAQLAEHDSSLSENGRSLCRKLEARVGRPVFYHLHKTRGRSSEEELSRKCPSCGGGWHLDEPLHLFDFRCDNCRLLSAVASSVRR